MKEIKGFFGEYRWLSNFCRAEAELNGMLYPTVEHAFQAAKTLSMDERLRVQACKTPNEAKKLGRKVTLRPNWDTLRLTVMERLTYQKFFRHPGLKEKLLATGDAYLEETNTWGDRFWGVCDGKGKNHLGKILMKVREALQPLE